jgi:sulfur-carrier protein adenylyltransferase/sulfurtransferase
MEIFAQYDLIVDGTDNFATRYLVNDACVLLGKPYVWGSIYRFDGQASVFWAEHGPCYRCLYPEPPPPGMVPSCAEGGVLGVLCASIGSIQVTEAIKLLTGIGDPLLGRLMIYDALDMNYRTVKVRKDPNCAVCGTNPTVTELIDYEAFCGWTGATCAATSPTARRRATRTRAERRAAHRPLTPWRSGTSAGSRGTPRARTASCEARSAPEA